MPTRWPAAQLAILLLALIVLGCAEPTAEQQVDQAVPPPAVEPAEPPDAVAHLEAGKRLLTEDRYEQAIEHFTSALEDARSELELERIDSVEADAFYQRARAYLEMGFPDTAVEDFNAAIQLAPRDGPSHLHRGRAHLLLGDLYKSLRDGTTAIRLQPGSAEAYRLRGLVYLQRQQSDRAAADLEQAIALDASLAPNLAPQLGETYFHWSQHLAEADEDAEAAIKLAKARELNPAFVDEQTAVVVAEPAPEPVKLTVAKPIVDEAQEHFERGRAHQAEQRFDQALIEFTEAIGLTVDRREAGMGIRSQRY